MEKLSYLATFISLIYGLGVANLLAHLASLIKRGRESPSAASRETSTRGRISSRSRTACSC